VFSSLSKRIGRGLGLNPDLCRSSTSIHLLITQHLLKLPLQCRLSDRSHDKRMTHNIARVLARVLFKRNKALTITG